MADKSDSKVTVTVHIARLATKTVNIFPSSVQVLNLPDGYKLTFDASVIRVALSGVESDMAALDTSSIVASIDAGQLTPGTHEVELVLDLDENIYHEPVTVSVTVSEIPDDTSDTPDTPEDPGTDEPVDDPSETDESDTDEQI